MAPCSANRVAEDAARESEDWLRSEIMQRKCRAALMEMKGGTELEHKAPPVKSMELKIKGGRG